MGTIGFFMRSGRTPPMPVNVRCPSPDCGASDLVPEEQPSRGARCRACGTALIANELSRTATFPAPHGQEAGALPQTFPIAFGRYQ
jgi:hypothetical protein